MQPQKLLHLGALTMCHTTSQQFTYVLPCVLTTICQIWNYYPYFTGEEIEAQQD